MAPGTQTDREKKLRSITRRYYTVWWFHALGPSFIFGIYPLFLRARGLNQFQINSVAALFFIVTFLTDIPTGAFADAIGRRASFLTGCVLSSAAFGLYFVSYSYWLFLVAEVIDGVGSTFRNGAIDAWAVDALDDAGFVGNKDQLFSRVSQIWRFGASGGALIGAYVENYDVARPWLLGAVGLLAAGLVGFFLMSGERRREGHISFNSLVGQLRERMANGMRSGFGQRTILLLSVANAIQLAAWAQFWFEWPGYFNDSFKAGTQVVGWLFCLFNLAAMIGAEIVARFRPSESSRAAFVGTAAALMTAILLAAGLAIDHTWLVLALFCLAHVCAGASGPIYQSWFNEQIEGDHRATLLSFQSTFSTFGASMGLPGGGRIADAFGVGVAWQTSGLVSALTLPCYWMLRPNRGPAELAPQPAK